MSKKTGSFCWLVLLTTLLLAFGCSHKPAYSDIDTAKSPANNNHAGSSSNSSAPADAQQSSPAATSSNANSQAPQAQASTAPTMPSFMDPRTGVLKDLPQYPRAHRVSVQFGPMQGINTFSTALKTTDPMDKIADFYERVIKENKWTVVDKVRDPEFSEWTLSKSNDNSAKIQIKKDPQSSALDIIIVRGEKVPGASN